MEEVLGFINKALEDAGVPYEFLEWTQKITYSLSIYKKIKRLKNGEHGLPCGKPCSGKEDK